MSLADFKNICAQGVVKSDYHYSSEFIGNVVVYDGGLFQQTRSDRELSRLKAELAYCLSQGPGVFIVRNGFSNTHIIDRMNTVYDEIIAGEKQENGGVGDHFSKDGMNDRIWNGLQKSCLSAPQVFSEYYSNAVLAIAAEAWLGPGYQITAQVNIVNPGSSAQEPHRDYHLGFQSDDVVSRYPLHAQIMSQYLTLQCGVAHSDMSISSGPTKFLPFSQQYKYGYTRWRDQHFMAYFEANFVQYELSKGDMVFFNPALFHAAGGNISNNSRRIGNLLQIVSSMSKPMESVDRQAMAEAVYPVLCDGNLSKVESDRIIASVCDGYSFPTNLDTDPPVQESASMTIAKIMSRALDERWSESKFRRKIVATTIKRRA